MNPKILAISCLVAVAFSCNDTSSNKTATTTTDAETSTSTVRQADIKDDVSQKNVVQVAVGSPDHTTLVKAVQAADLVNALSNAGPFTVFAPTNAAFDKLPKGTVEGLLKPESKDALIDILQYHVSLGVFKAESLQDGQVLGQVNGGNITVAVKNGKIMIGDATVVASVPAANGIVHVIDGVLLPPKN
ncbi:MAG: fasciclin domain-containing protein [Chitinophagaceae bacterium]|nr:MAG: fasciclin domain-containing protein [Chitinophagaceae bacterium]